MLKIYRRQAYRATPWKNGGGTTHEVLRSSEDDMFDWRVSVAQIERAGPFSFFPSHIRHMALLAGDGVRLRFEAEQRTLSQVGDLIEFDGAAAVQCELLGGPCTDLNLMVARHLSAQVAVLPLPAPLELEAKPGQTLIAFNIGAPLRLEHGGEAVWLGTSDCVLLESARGRLILPAGASMGAPSVVFFATIWHGRQS